MIWFIISIAAFVVVLGALAAFIFSDSKIAAGITGVVALIVGVIAMFTACFWQNSDGEAKVMVDSWNKTVVGSITTAGSGWKPAWVDFVDFDTFAQEAIYAGDRETPEYTGGSVNGAEITISVGGINGGSTKGWMDATFVYDIEADKIVVYKGKEMPAVEALYKQFKSQDRFTKTIVERGGILSVARTIPSGYSAIELRGVKRPDAEAEMQEALDKDLGQYGVTVRQVSIQDVRYPKAVEKALEAVETANQKAETAEANKRAAIVDAETALERAKGEANANAEISRSLTPEVLEIRRLEALVEVSKNGDLIIDGGSGGVLVNRGAPSPDAQ